MKFYRCINTGSIWDEKYVDEYCIQEGIEKRKQFVEADVSIEELVNDGMKIYAVIKYMNDHPYASLHTAINAVEKISEEVLS